MTSLEDTPAFVAAARPASGPKIDRTQQMLHAPLLPTLLRLATPNVIGLFAMTIVIGYDGYILGRIGADALAGVALVFPLSMLMVQMSGGGLGGGASTAAVARALGGGRRDEASLLAQHALLIAFALAALFMVALAGFGRPIYAAMGGRGGALDDALAYSRVLFGGAIVICSTNVLAAIVRGSGNMLLPSLLLLGAALLHLVLCPLLVFGLGPLRGLGVAGAATSTLVTNALAALVMTGYLLRADGAVNLRLVPWRVRLAPLRSILRVGLPASLSPVLSNSSIALATTFIGSYGTAALAGYGVAARLEYVLVPIAFGFGTALTAMVATNMGRTRAAGHVGRQRGGGGDHGRNRSHRRDCPRLVDGLVHRRRRGPRLRRRLPERRGRFLLRLRPGPGAVLRIAGRRSDDVAADRQRLATGHRRGWGMALCAGAPAAGRQLLHGHRGEPCRLCRNDRAGDPAGRLGALTNASAIKEPARSGSSPITGRISSLYVPRRMLILCSRPCVVDKGER